MAKITIGVRVAPELAGRLDRIAAQIEARSSGVEITRGEATRLAVERGVADLEAELGLSLPSPEPKERKAAARKPPK